MLNNKYDFTVVFSVTDANPNGDPLDENRPRTKYDGRGFVTDVCIKRKLRNRLQDMGYDIFVQSDGRETDGYHSLADRLTSLETLSAESACSRWMDVRSFGQLLAFSGKKSGGKSKSKPKSDTDSDTSENSNGISIGIRGPVSIGFANSVDPITVQTIQITKSVNGASSDKKASDTMGKKHIVPFAVYTFSGSINPQLAEKTGFTDSDAGAIISALKTMFDNDESSARPSGSMVVEKVVVWKHEATSGIVNSAYLHRAVTVTKNEGVSVARSMADYTISVDTSFCDNNTGLSVCEY